MLPYKENIEEQISVDNFIVSINYKKKHGVMVSEHWHDFYELLYILDGEAKQIINNIEFTLHPGDILLISPGDIHSTVSTIDDSYVSVIVFTLKDKIPTIYYSTKNNNKQEMSKYFSQINREYTFKEKGHQFIIQGLILQILGLIDRKGNELISNLNNYTEEAIMITDYIKNNIHTQLTLQSVATYAGYSPAYFSKYFKELLGISFKKYLDKMKILAAKSMLSEGLTVSQTAERLGYDNISSFCRTFKRITENSPSYFFRDY